MFSDINKLIYDNYSLDHQNYSQYSELISELFLEGKRPKIKKYLDSNINLIIGNYFCEVERNYKLAEKFYRYAIEENNSDAYNNLAWLILITENNLEKVIRLLRQASNYNNNFAMTNLAIIYNSLGNYDKTIYYLKMGAEHGNEYAKKLLYLY